jgi:hypothetical protein
MTSRSRIVLYELKIAKHLFDHHQYMLERELIQVSIVDHGILL